MDLLSVISTLPAVISLSDALAKGRRCVATGVSGSSTSLVAAAVAQTLKRPVVLVVAHLDEADEIQDELSAAGASVLRLPGLEVLPGETGVSVELFAERLSVVRAVVGLSDGTVVVCPIQGLMQSVPAAASLERLSRVVSRGQNVDHGDLIRWLDQAGYTRVEAAEEPGDFAVRGGLLDVFPASGGEGPVRVEFFGDQVERIMEVDPETMGSSRSMERVELVCATPGTVTSDEGSVNFLELLPRNAIAIISETMEVTEQGRGYYERVSDPRGIYGPPAIFKLLADRFAGLAEINQFSAGAATADSRVELPFSQLPPFAQDASDAVKELAAMAADQRVVVYCQNAGELQRFQELVTEFAPEAAKKIESAVAYVHRGFVVDLAEGTKAEKSLSLVPYHELLHRYHARRRNVRLKAGRAMDTFLDFAPGDYVVHADHGIAKFIGLKVMKPPRHREVAGGTDSSHIPAGLREAHTDRATIEPQEYLTLEFAGKAKLHVPAPNIDQVQKYIGGFHGKPQLSTLGGQRWKSQKEKVSESVKDLAAEMLRVRAAREHMPGIHYPPDTTWQKEFEAEFPYEETEDQLAALAEIKKDMLSTRPMDRLICGDVGFGKTELAIRAAFKAAEYGKQVAVLVPTTVLAEQHERTFRARFADYPFKVESLSRFKTNQEANQILAAVRKGHVDIVIGTHRLLSQDVKFNDLGLVIVDEEQRFGVEHKERLLRLRLTVDVLTLSATPIPRTLHMSMLGLRDISSLTTPPLDRRAIVTEVIPYNERRIQQAIARELSRDGQVFFVHNRVFNIKSVADDIQKLAPDARIVIGHGQMPPEELEAVMLKFMRREADILVSTTIIESGIDISTANTMFINDADRFGLADLHQLRGRVGRYKHRAYCYMLLANDRTVKEVAQKRLKAIEQYSMLGAGFKIAMRDLEIRGAGNLLGSEQSGHIAAVGYEMYCRLLDEAVRGLKSEAPPAVASQTAIDIGIVGTIPKAYIPSDQRRMEAYRRIATAASDAELRKVGEDLKGAYGEPAKPVSRLLDLAELRVLAAGLGVKTISIRGQDVLFRTDSPKAVQDRLISLPKAGAEGRNSGILRAKDLAPTKTRVAPATPKPDTLPSFPASAVRVLPPPTGERLHEVYLRPPANYMDPETLLRVLRKRLATPL